MSRSAFRRFDFFEVDTLSEEVAVALGSMPTCATADGGMLMFGDRTGNVIFADRNFKVSGKRHKLFRGKIDNIFYLYDPASHTRQYLVVVGDDAPPMEDPAEALPAYFVKIYAVADLVRPLHVLSASLRDAALTCAAVLSDGHQIALGYSTGAIVVFSGNYLGDSAQRANPFVTLLAGHIYPVCALHFCEAPTKRGADRRIRLFAVMDSDATSSTSKGPPPSSTPAGADVGDGEDPAQSGVLVFDTSAHGGSLLPTAVSSRAVKAIDERGAAAKCSTLMRGLGELVLARSEAVYTYSVEDRGGALAIPGEKLCLCSAGRYTLVASVEERAAGTTQDGDVAAPGPAKPKRPTITIYDLKNKIICGTAKKYHLPLNEKILHAMNDGGVVYLVTSSGLMIRCREKDTHRKLDVLLNQATPPLYSLAIMLAGEEQLEGSEIMKLYKQYGDHLYEEKDFDGAIVQYSHTIGYIPSSSVITKFLDPYRILNLIAYLEKLHEMGLAGSDHITLLLSCHAKVKDEAKLDALLESIALSPASADAETSGAAGAGTVAVGAGAGIFNAEQAITTLQTAGYTAHALRVAARFYQHASYVGIQMKKTPPVWDDVLCYLAYMPFVAPVDDIMLLLKEHGRSLLANRPSICTGLLVKLCTADYASLLPPGHPLAPAPTTTPAPSTISTTAARTALLEKLSFASASPAVQENALAVRVLPTERVPAADVLHLFGEDETQRRSFLEGVVESSGRMHPKIAAALMESYLEEYQPKAQLLALKRASDPRAARELEGGVQALEAQVMGILDSAHAQYDAAHALLLMHSFGFQRGQRFLLEKQQSTELLLRMLIESDDTKEVFKVLRREGGKDPELYVQILTHLVQESVSGRDRDRGTLAPDSPTRPSHSGPGDEESDVEEGEDEDEDEDKWNAIMDVMDLVEKEAALSPLQVLAILALNPKLPLYVAAGFIGNTFKDLSDDIDTVEGEVEAAMRNIQTISHSKVNQVDPRKRQQRAGVEEEEDDDEDYEEDEEESDRQSKAKREEYWADLRNSMVECSANHEAFFTQLENSTSGFDVVVEHFGRSIIS